MSKKLLTYIIFFSLLLAAFYYFLFKGTDNWKVQLPILSYVQPFHFTNQDGQAFSDKELLNKITVVEYFFTTCKGICPKLNTNMKEIYSIYKTNPDFQIRYKNIHCLPLKSFKYMVHFAINTENKIVHIYAVLSTHQDPNKNWL